MADSKTNTTKATKVRFEATIHSRRKDLNVDAIADLALDRVPDPKGRIRALVSADDCVRLLALGFEVRLQHAHPIRPLDPKLIETDDSVRRLVQEKLRGLLPRDAKLEL